jgi:hypothetical protein
MRPSRVALAVVVSVVVTGAAQAASARDQLIRPGVGISKARLGMTTAQVRRAMGAPQAVTRKAGRFGRALLELQYGYGSYNVLLSGPRGRERVIAVTTYFAGERTAQGVGVNSLEARAAKAYPGLRCDAFTTHRVSSKFAFRGLRRVCVLGPRDAPQTVFVVRGPVQQVDGPVVGTPDPSLDESWPREARIAEVIVRVAGFTHPDEEAARRF